MDLALLVERVCGRSWIGPARDALGGASRLVDRFGPRSTELHQLGAVHQADPAERNQLGLRVAPSRQSGGPFARAVDQVDWLQHAIALQLRGLSEVAGEEGQQPKDDTAFGAVIEGLEAGIERVGNVTAKRFEAEVKAIMDGLSKNDAKSFEIAQEKLGKLMGYRSGRSGDDAAPDPWWCAGDELCIVFEDHTNVEEQNTKGPLGANKVRQAAGHPNWIRQNVALSSKAEIVPVMVTPCSCRRRSLRVPLSPGSPVPRDPPGDFGAVLRPGRHAT